MSEEQIKDMILKQCLELTTNNDFRPPISAYNGVDIDDVVRVYKQLQDKKTYIDLVKENTQLKNKLKDIEKILDADYCVENVYQAMCQYLNIHDYELDLEDYLKEN